MFVKVRIENINVEGLLDTGASVSLLGNGCREIVEKLNIEMKPLMSNVKTASGHQHRILGKVSLNIKYNDEEHHMELYLCPDLKQRLYLGIDFWRKFKLAPDVVGVEEINMEKIHQDFKSDKTEYRMKPHDLNVEQSRKLETVVKNFDTF